jgi:uracil-DNA glycosylase
MDAKKPSELWETLNLLDDYLAAGFRREHPVLKVDHAAAAPAVRSTRPASAASAAAPEARPPLAEPPVGTGQPQTLAALAGEVMACTRCPLSLNRNTAVPGEGSESPLVLIVGEAPGAEEDKTGRPFVGPAGKYLDSWLKPIALDRANCFIANTVKCRPPENREPRPEEMEACAPYLDRQIAILRPRVILCLGRIAAHRLIGTQASLGSLRGRVHTHAGVPLVVTYHPSAVLRDESLKRPVWEDLKLLKTLL